MVERGKGLKAKKYANMDGGGGREEKQEETGYSAEDKWAIRRGP